MRRNVSSTAGFTLVEALVATVLMGLVLAALATITAQWLPNWDRSLSRVQHDEMLDIAVQRIVGDLAASEFIPPSAQTTRPLFEGTASSVIFVRTTIGPNARGGLDVIRIAESADGRGAILVRSRAPFVPMPPQASTASQSFTDPVVLVRSPARASFSYAGRDRVWREVWRDEATLPSAVRIIVRDGGTGRLLPVSTIVLLHADVSAQCSGTTIASNCEGGPSTAAKSGDTRPVTDTVRQIQ